MGKNETLFIRNSIVLFTKRHDFRLVQKKNSSLDLWAKSSRLLFLMWENSYTSQNTKKGAIADVRIPECTLRSNSTNKQADPVVHFLKRNMS